MPLFTFTPERRERFQRVAVVTIVVLLATIASNRLVRAVQPTPTDDSFVEIYVDETWDDDCTPSRDHIAHEVEMAAREAAEEARYMIEEAQRMAEEQQRIAREVERELKRDLVVVR